MRALEAVERKIEQFVESLDDKDVKAIIKKIPAGKRLRAKLMLEIAGEGILVIKAAAIIEMIHAASLLHDDVIDEAMMRRGVSSLNALFGNKSAIMIGDILYSKAFYELVDLDRKIAKIISNAVVLLSIGERKDVVLSQTFNIDEKLYKQMLYEKTASLIEAAAWVAAILAGKDPKIFKDYGKKLGIAFQMIDDILDIISDSKTLGKPAFNDFKEGKTTLPYIYLYQKLNKEEKEYLKSLHKKSLLPKEQEWIMQKFKEHNIIQKAKSEAITLINEAVTLMQKANEKNLEAIAYEMVNRSF